MDVSVIGINYFTVYCYCYDLNDGSDLNDQNDQNDPDDKDPRDDPKTQELQDVGSEAIDTIKWSQKLPEKKN